MINKNLESLLTQDELKQILHYDPETGVFTWLVDSNRRVKKGSIAGSKTGNGYVQVGINEFMYKVHRLAFLYMTGSFPPDCVDHINQVRDDNRWANLRPCTNQQNQFNRSKYKDNKWGYKGVGRIGNKWQAKICIGGVRRSIGTFDTPELASQAYQNHAKKLHGEFAYLGGE